MKTKTTFIAAIATVVILVGCSERDMKRELLSISAKRENDPATMMLGDAYNSYVKQTFLIDANVETGIITMANGETAKYWFRAHSKTNEKGETLFHLGDGSRIFMSGYFSFTVHLPEEQIESSKELKKFIRANDGVVP